MSKASRERRKKSRERREKAFKRLTDLMEQQQRYADKIAVLRAKEAKAAEAEAEKEYLKAAPERTSQAIGRGIGVGGMAGPVGAVVGGVLSSIPAHGEEYESRRELGESTGEAIWNTWMNPVTTIGKVGSMFEQSPEAAGVIGRGIESKKGEEALLEPKGQTFDPESPIQAIERMRGEAIKTTPEITSPSFKFQPRMGEGAAPPPTGLARPATPSPGLAPSAALPGAPGAIGQAESQAEQARQVLAAAVRQRGRGGRGGFGGLGGGGRYSA